MRAFGSIASLLVAASAASAAPGILLIGDSTVTDGAGWGKGFCADTKGLARCTNLAVSGVHDHNFVARSFDGVPSNVMITVSKTANTFATIQFGHNDQKVVTADVFATNLEKLTNTIKNAGCSPILVTSLARRVVFQLAYNNRYPWPLFQQNNCRSKKARSSYFAFAC
ncbi:hypothetical protein RSAG8_08603, partial [Rhizoctonia solani AG-8 WAC10335]